LPRKTVLHAETRQSKHFQVARIFTTGSTNSCLLLCVSLAQCAPESGTCQSGSMCKTAENGAKLFSLLHAEFYFRTLAQLHLSMCRFARGTHPPYKEFCVFQKIVKEKM
jgi:hypothetical protein